MKVVIVGRVAAGPKAASKIMRMKPDADVTIIENGRVTHAETDKAELPADMVIKLQNREDFVFLDVRSPQEHTGVRLSGSILIPLGVLRKRFGEIPEGREIITFCQMSLRGYEAALILKAAGFTNVKVLDGGIAMWPYEKKIS
jgi:rhodanese-related sulfurtransferase